MLAIIPHFFSKERVLAKSVHRITGIRPRNIGLYKLALTPAGNGTRLPSKSVESNERLEFLGDAVLGSVVAEYLFRKYPFENEGFLTELRSRLVNRETLNMVATKMGLNQLIRVEPGFGNRNKFTNGNALEALVGAVYLDRGYAECSSFIIKKIVKPFADLDNIINTTLNFKSKIIEYAQAAGKTINFEIVSHKTHGNTSEFIVQVLLDQQPLATGNGFSKKKAEQAAAEKGLATLQGF